MDVSTIWDFCGEVVGSIRPRKGYVPATVTRIDADGTVWVTTGDGTEAPASTCAAGVAVGDVVSVQWSGAQMGVVGNASDPAASMGTVRAARKAAESAAKVASGAKDIANAIGQHFWADDNGAHVSTEKDDPTGERNILMNSLGILLRQGSAWLASFSDSAVAFYDGLGNTAANIVAQFGVDGAVIGYASGQHVSIDQDSLDIMSGNSALAKFGETAVIGQHRVAGSMAIYLGKSSSYNEGITEIVRWTDANSLHQYIRAIHDRNNGCDYVVIGDSSGTYPAYGNCAVALGRFATGTGPHGTCSVAEGRDSYAGGVCSHAQNLSTVAAYASQTAIGKYNSNSNANAFEVGNGTADDARSNAFAVAWDGTTTHDGDVPWTTFPLASAASHYSSTKPLRYRKWGQMVNLMGAVTPNADVPAGMEYALTIGTLPEGCRPQEELTQLCQGSGTASWMLRITTGGVVTAERYRTGSGYAIMPAPSSGSSGAWLTMNCTFIV